MGLFKMTFLNKLFLAFAFAFSAAIHSSEILDPATPSHMQVSPSNRILFLMHTGKTAQAFDAYQQYAKESGSQDFELIERLGLILLDQGYRLKDPETQLLTLFGAGLATNEKTLYIIEGGLTSGQPELELIALNFVGAFQNERAHQLLYRAMTSNHLLIRLEAAFQLAKKKDLKAAGLAESLMSKLPEELWPLFPQFYAVIGTPQAKKILRKLLTNHHEKVRIAAINSIAEYGHDDFLPMLRRLASHHEPAQQEACAAALGILKDENSVDRLIQLSKSPNVSIQLAAYKALYQLGRIEVREKVQILAKAQDLYAIALLGEMPGSEKTLVPLLKSDNIHVRANAAAALLELCDSNCLLTIAELLLSDSRDLAIAKTTSPGQSLQAWRVIPSARQNLENTPVTLEMSLNIREAALAKAVELPEHDFIALANIIFEKQQNDLIPVLVDVLVNHPTPAVIDLLKKHQQKAGAPLVRNYCNLALYRLKQEGPYAENLRLWVTQQQNVDLIRFRTLLPWDIRESEPFLLTPQETSRLLVQSFEAFVASQDDKGIDILISLIQTGNSKNKYALIGLLMRAIQ